MAWTPVSGNATTFLRGAMDTNERASASSSDMIVCYWGGNGDFLSER